MMKLVMRMEYTVDQYALMEKLAKGLHYDALSEYEQEIVRYLDSVGLVQPRAQRAEDYMELSQQGKQVLHAHQNLLQARQEELQASQKQAQEKACEQAQQKAEKKKDRAFEVFLVFLGYALGLISPHIPEIALLVWEFLQRIICWIDSVI